MPLSESDKELLEEKFNNIDDKLEPLKNIPTRVSVVESKIGTMKWLSGIIASVSGAVAGFLGSMKG